MVNDNAQITTTDYTGGYTYENSSLKFINQAEGYIEPDGIGGYDYVYQYKDHLGNIRLSYSDVDDNGVIHGASTQLFFDDFEAASRWDGSGASWGQSITAFDDNVTFDGDYSGRVYAAMGTSVAVHSKEWVTIDNESDTDYIYTAWAYSESPIIRLGLAMKEDGEAGYLTLFDDILIVDELNQWVYVEKRVTVPAHITSLNIRIESAAWENRVGNVWFDNVSIRRVNDPTAIEIVEEKHYYPFGLQHRGYNSQVTGMHYPYGFGGKELSEELDLNTYDFGARNYSPDLGRWFNIDNHADRYFNWSPYNYAINNPINVIDPDGNDIYILTWFSKDGETGHAGIAIDNYKTVNKKDANGNDILDANGNPVTEQVKDGTFTYYDLWPNDPVGKTELQDDVKADYSNGIIINSLDDLKNTDPTTQRNGNVDAEGRSADGIVQIETNFNQDGIAKKQAQSDINSNRDYNACENNCSTFAQRVLNAALSNQRIDASQEIKPGGVLRIWPFNYKDSRTVAPNNLYNKALKVKGAKRIKGPKSVNAKPYLEYFGKSNRGN